MITVTWIYQSADYSETAAADFVHDISRRYSALATPRGFAFEMIGAAEILVAAAPYPQLCYRGTDLLAERRAFIVGDKALTPQGQAHMQAVYRAIDISPAVLLNRSFKNSDYLERDKLAFAAYAATMAVPTIKTVSVPAGRIGRESAAGIVQAIGGFPLLLKPRELSMGIGVLRVDSHSQLIAALDIVGQSGFGYVAQPYLEHGGDMRVFVRNGKVVQSLLRRPAPGSHIASVSQGGSIEVTQDHLLVEDFCSRLGINLAAGWLCIDWLMTESGPILNEWSTAHGGFTLLPERERNIVADAFFDYISEMTS